MEPIIQVLVDSPISALSGIFVKTPFSIFHLISRKISNCGLSLFLCDLTHVFFIFVPNCVIRRMFFAPREGRRIGFYFSN